MRLRGAMKLLHAIQSLRRQRDPKTYRRDHILDSFHFHAQKPSSDSSEYSYTTIVGKTNPLVRYETLKLFAPPTEWRSIELIGLCGLSMRWRTMQSAQPSIDQFMRLVYSANVQVVDCQINRTMTITLAKKRIYLWKLLLSNNTKLPPNQYLVILQKTNDKTQ